MEGVVAVPVAAGLASPRSPTLSVASMILPENDLRSISPPPYVERPPSPPTRLYSHSNKSAATLKPRGPSPQIKSSPLSSRSSRSTIRTMGDSDGSSKKSGGSSSPHDDDALASSPTIADAPLPSHTPNGWDQKRRFSSTSSSVDSEDLERLKWLGFDGHSHFDDSGVVLEEEEDEERDQFPVDVKVDGEPENDRWLDGQSEADDENSSAALSRRAELILANAKKRLNVMEGNLRGARQSLVVSPTLSSSKSDLSLQLAATRERDRRLYAGIGPIPPRTRGYYSSTSSSNGSPGHSRGASETAVPLPFSLPYTSRVTLGKRASSAMGVASGPWSPEGYGQGRFPIRESRSFEVMRDPRGNGLTNHEDRDHPLRSPETRGSRTPPNVLETLPENGEGPVLHRSASSTTDLRSQMNDLKERISSLKQKAKDETMRRRSLQSLRTPSPFTCAETWYSGANVYKNGGSPISADAGVGFTTESPVRKTLYEDDASDSIPKFASSELAPGPVRSPHEPHHTVEPPKTASSTEYQETHFEETEDFPLLEDEANEGAKVQDDMYEVDDNDYVSLNDEDIDQGGSSIYEDAVYEMPVTERHEDRVDAFDYENFFLHSAMGTYSSANRRSSSSSADSVATTRPAPATHTRSLSSNSAKRISMHQRNASADSVSTVASFATAAEEQSDDEDENEQLDQFSQQILPTQHVVTPRYAMQNGRLSPRSDSAMNLRKANVSPAQASQTSRVPSPGSDIVTGLQTSKIFSILLESPWREEPRLALNEEEKQLIYSLAASFQQVCANLQSMSGDQYERKEWRRRLDEARRMLNGEGAEGQPF